MRQKITAVIMTLSLCSIIPCAFAGQLTAVRGWNESPTFYDGLESHEGTATDIDIDGEVGHPIFVSGPTAHCEPTLNWNLNLEVASGVLPPGVTLVMDGSGYGSIQGIPTKRGHWIVSMRTSHLTCDESSFMGFTQQVRFHITGTGDVIQ